MFRWVACFLGESHDSGRRMGWSRVVESVGYTEENSARTGSGWTDSRSGLVPGDFLGWLVLQRAPLCRGNFFISESWEGSSRHLNRFWVRTPVYRAERAYRLFSVVAVGRPFNRAKPAAWDPPPWLLIRAYS